MSAAIRMISTLPHFIASAVSMCFTGVFFWSLGEDPTSGLLFLGLALALESAKILFLWRYSSQTRRRFFEGALIVLLALFSVMASVSFGINTLIADHTVTQAATRTTAQFDELIAQTEAQYTELQRKLEQLPVEWRITKNEYVEQLRQVREDLLTLISQRADVAAPAAGKREQRSYFWIELARLLGVNPKALLLAYMSVIAVVLELTIAGTVPQGIRGQGGPPSTKTTSDRVPAERNSSRRDPLLYKYAQVVLSDSENGHPKSIRKAAEELGLSVVQARPLHDRLKTLGIIETRATKAVQRKSRADALAMVA